jgi:ATP-binding cassette subfamily B protein
MKRRRWLIPETIQTSAMDCGPATLQALLSGFGIDASYGRLREACRTDVDGTSIGTLEELAGKLGLEVEQVMIPMDHLFLPEAKLLPCILVLRVADGNNHFVTVWRRHGSWLQVMDPATGRRWVTVASFLETVYKHEQAVPAGDWFAWASSDAYRSLLAARMRAIGCRSGEVEAKIDAAVSTGEWYPLAALDAAVRLAAALRSRTLVDLTAQPHLIPSEYWSAIAGPEPDTVLLRGAVAIHASGTKQPEIESLPASLRTVLTEKPTRLAGVLWDAVRADGVSIPFLAIFAIVLAAAGALCEILLFRSLLGLAGHLSHRDQRLTVVAVLFALLANVTIFEWSGETLVRRMGRRIEIRIRAGFCERLPRLGDRYFKSRLVSDMAQRVHSIQIIRDAASLAGTMLSGVSGMVATLFGIAWFYPGALWPAAICASICTLLPILAQRTLNERDLRAREYSGALSRFYLDALMGAVPIRAHGAAPALQYFQSVQLGQWAGARLRLVASVVRLGAFQMLLGYVCAAWTVLSAMRSTENPAAVVLLVYWALNLPQLGQIAGRAAYQWPALRNSLLRILEPLSGVETAESPGVDRGTVRAPAIEFRGVDVLAGGHPVLRDISLSIAAGEHIGIVGASGAGKSSLVGLLLGLYEPCAGEFLLDGQPVTAQILRALRRETAWVDPQVQIWNDTLFENLRYGLDEGEMLDAGRAVQEAGLAEAIEKLPRGLQSSLGEGGTLLSGGEGQRVRMARAFGKGGVRLAILDEPSRGLDRGMRIEFTRRARAAWKDATLLCITHDVAGTREFSRVLVMEDGRVVEDGNPETLFADRESRYRKLCELEEQVRDRLWNGAQWRRLALAHGRL